MKIFKKNELFKSVGIILAISVLLTWLVPSARFEEGVLVSGEFTRIGLFDISTFGLLGFNYFPFIFMFLLIVTGFYKVLENINEYQSIVGKCANRFESKPILFALISMVFYGVLASIVTDYYVLFFFVPFTIAVAAKLKLTKNTSFVATFGGVLLGILCSTYNVSVAKELSNLFTFTNYNPETLATLAIFIIGGILLGYLAIEDTKKNGSNDAKIVENFLANKEEEKVEEKKVIKKGANKKTVVVKTKKVNILPISIVLGVLSVIILLAFIGWNSLGVTLFSDLHKSITEATIAGVPVFSYILGSSVPEFGSWTLFSASGVILVAMVILQIIYRVKFSTVVDNMTEGFGKIAKTIFIIFIIYIVLETSYFFPTIATITNFVVETFGDNIGTWLFASGFSSIFTVEFQYTINEIGGLITHLGTETPEVVALATQLAYGLVSFVAPTSIMLASGLTILGINLKEYFKFIWKFLVAMLIVIVLVLIILLLI